MGAQGPARVTGNRLLTPHEAADVLNISAATTYRLIRRGDLPGIACRPLGPGQPARPVALSLRAADMTTPRPKRERRRPVREKRERARAPREQGPGIIARLGGVDREAAARLAYFWKVGSFPDG
jgi:hypothetical protein